MFIRIPLESSVSFYWMCFNINWIRCLIFNSSYNWKTLYLRFYEERDNYNVDLKQFFIINTIPQAWIGAFHIMKLTSKICHSGEHWIDERESSIFIFDYNGGGKLSWAVEMRLHFMLFCCIIFSDRNSSCLMKICSM